MEVIQGPAAAGDAQAADALDRQAHGAGRQVNAHKAHDHAAGVHSAPLARTQMERAGFPIAFRHIGPACAVPQRAYAPCSARAKHAPCSTRAPLLQVLLCKLIDVLDNAVPYEVGPEYDLENNEEPR